MYNVFKLTSCFLVLWWHKVVVVVGLLCHALTQRFDTSTIEENETEST